MKSAPSRRAVLQGAAASIVLAAAPACNRKREQEHQEAPPRPRSLADDLHALIVVIGPWAAGAPVLASLLPRYLSEEWLKELAPNAKAFSQLAARFTAHSAASASINLAELTEPERVALIRLTIDLYQTDEVRLAINNTPEPGQCIGDPQWHTRPPHAG